mgnify:CR=1 FL=1
MVAMEEPMAHIPKIIAGVDGSEDALVAVRWAADRATRCGGELILMCSYAVASFSAAGLDGGLAALDDATLRAGAQRVVDDARQVAEEIVGDADVKICTRVEAGDPASVLTELSAHADMIVIGSRGGGGFADRFLGTVSSAVPAHSKCPVVVVPVRHEGRPFTPVERIVVGVDGSDVASTALKKAVDEAILWDADLTVVTAVPIATGASMMSWVPATVDREGLMEDVRLSMDRSIADARRDRKVRVARHALDGSPAALLTEFSTAVDLVVVGTRGRGGFAGMLLGSTSQTVLQHSTCPVMTVPSRHRDKTPSPTQSWERA